MEQETKEHLPLIERRKSLVPKIFELVGRVIHVKDPNADLDLAMDLGADSLDHTEIVMEIEKEFNIRITDDKAEELRTVNKIADYLANTHKL